MLQDGWDTKPGVTLCFGRWQEILPQLLHNEATALEFDGIYFDTYAEHSYDMEHFHTVITTPASSSSSSSSSSNSGRTLLAQPHGVYSFFNGLAPDNLFFHAVACNVVKKQLDTRGVTVDFLTCQLTVPTPDSEQDQQRWDGIRRKYWHGRDVYYLPKCTWNQEYLGRKTKQPTTTDDGDNNNDRMVRMDTDDDDVGATKRQRR